MIDTEQLAEGVWLFRYIPKGTYGDPYSFVCTGVRSSDASIRLKGAMGRFDDVVWNDMYGALHKLGFKHFIVRRNGGVVTKSVKPTRKDKDYE
jgi:hypothetical protein